jgi:hypothetical protein
MTGGTLISGTRTRLSFILRLFAFFAVLTAASGVSQAHAQGVDCRYFKVSAERVSAFEEPRDGSRSIATLERDNIVCVAGDEQMGGRIWAFIPFKLEPGNRHSSVQGWAVKDSLAPASQQEVAAMSEARVPVPPPATLPPTQVPGPPPGIAQGESTPAPPGEEHAPSGEEVVKFSEPIKSYGFPVQGHSLEQLVHGVPTFPPIEGLPDDVWKKPCDSCHNWNQQTLCQQAMIYAQDVKMTMRKKHPYGGPEKLAMRNWAEHGCQ